MSGLAERVMLDGAFQAACQRYAHGNGSSGAIAAAAIAVVEAEKSRSNAPSAENRPTPENPHG